MKLEDIKDNEARNITAMMLEVLEDNVKEKFKLEILNYVTAITVSNQEKAKITTEADCEIE